MPYEILASIFSEVRNIDPAGWTRRTLDRDDIPRGSLGWIVVTHVCQLWRAVSLNLKLLWAADVLAFPNRHALRTLVERAGSMPIELDLDRAALGGRFRDIGEFWDLIVSNPTIRYNNPTRGDNTRLFSLAKSIICTLSSNDPVIASADYTQHCVMSTESWLWELDSQHHFPHLTRLTIPFTEDVIHNLIDISAPHLELVDFVAVQGFRHYRSLKPRPDESGYYVARRQTQECLIDLDAILDFVRSHASHLRRLHLNGVMIESPDDQGAHVRVQCQADIRVSSASTASIINLQKWIRTTGNWELTTLSSDFTHLPKLDDVYTQPESYNVLSIMHSKRVTFLTFANSDMLSPIDDTLLCPNEAFLREHQDGLDVTVQRLNLYIRPGIISMACRGKIGRFFDKYAKFIDHIFIDRLERSLPSFYCPRDSKKNWTFLQTVTSLETLTFYDMSCVNDVLMNTDTLSNTVLFELGSSHDSE